MRLAIYAALAILSCTLSGNPVVGPAPQSVADVSKPGGDNVKVEAWVQDLRVPWSLVFLPDGRALVSERGGAIRLIVGGKLQKKPYASIDVSHRGEGGLMGLALHPGFPEKPYVYAMHTYQKGTRTQNRVVRLTHKGNTGELERVIIDGIPGARNHNGGRIAFGPDGMLYVTTGEKFEASLAQDMDSLGGKILRLMPDGSIPADNPFKGSPVYSFGHRNPQGLAWQPGTGRLFISEHGPSGEFGTFAHDEINIITKGGNYGWPRVIGAPGKEPYIDPIAVWKDSSVPPSGAAFYTGNTMPHLRGDLFVATLRSECLLRIRLDEGNSVSAIERWFEDRYGRIRDVVQGPDGALYFLTNNTDGRGTPQRGDDKVYRILPSSG